jgi:ATP phosphoribosyltransferase
LPAITLALSKGRLLDETLPLLAAAGLVPDDDPGASRKLILATRRDYDWARSVQRGARIRVATKYVNTAREHFAAKGMHVDLIHLYGSMELAPLAGLADAIVDLVSTGNTLQANGLVAVEDIMPISARLIVNPGALKLKRDVVKPLIDAIARVAERRQVAAAPPSA